MVTKLLVAAYAVLILAVVFPGGLELQWLRDKATFALVLLFLANVVGFLFRGFVDDVLRMVRREPPSAATGEDDEPRAPAPTRTADDVARDAEAMRRQFQAGHPATNRPEDPIK